MEPVWGFGLSERARELTGGLFKAADVAKKFGIRYGRLKEWLKHIPPSVEQADGPGTRNIFTRSDLYKLFLFRELIEKGGLERSRARCGHVGARQRRPFQIQLHPAYPQVLDLQFQSGRGHS